MSEEIRPKLPVHIHNNADVDNEIVNLRMSMGEELEWHSDGDEFTVEFPITPFAQSSFVVPPGGSVLGRFVRTRPLPVTFTTSPMSRWP
jgi:hypothetical protein